MRAEKSDVLARVKPSQPVDMDKPSKRKTLDTHDGMEDFGDGGGAAHHESARKRTSTGGSGSSRGKKAVVVENPG